MTVTSNFYLHGCGCPENPLFANDTPNCPQCGKAEDCYCLFHKGCNHRVYSMAGVPDEDDTMPIPGNWWLDTFELSRGAEPSEVYKKWLDCVTANLRTNIKKRYGKKIMVYLRIWKERNSR